MRKEKQPWNPFPLACLKVEGLSACAKSVLIYLGVRSNYQGETCVGCRTMQRELVRSEDFITQGLKELRAKGIIKENLRNRHKGQADWRTISPSVLPSKGESTLKSMADNNPEEPTSTLLERVSALPSGDDINPAHHDRTLQIESLPPNLSDRNLSDQTSKAVSKQVSEQAEASCLSAERKEELVLLYETLGWGTGQGDSLVEAFGLQYPLAIHEESLWKIADYLKVYEKDVAWITSMVRWAHGHKFWKTCTPTIASVAKALDNFTEKGLAAQYERWLANKPKD
jgi:hypothetical protein